ncbi:methyltransferase [Trichodelitschia bisporula]|uniref:tRNA N(3)-methylcytidine methyltransferase n=1 Tax=Trichodelitschia bisporula TaxID=703511 RepID=A0A6G1IBP5_9PEZI|nr:methyltransferase [Trichodelitschia bisporula]
MRAVVTVPEPTADDDASAYGVPGYIQPVRQPRTDAPPNSEKRRDPFQFGSRVLEEGHDIFEFNAWDHVETDDAYKEFAETQYAMQRETPVSEFDKKRFNDQPEKWWNKFYANNAANFFKNRKWLAHEFPVLVSLTKPDAPATVILEVGAGAGNTAFPILALNQNPHLRIHACDFSKKAVELIRNNEAYNNPAAVGHIEASVWDIASPPDPVSSVPCLPEGVAPGSVDIVMLIFIFSALAPSQWTQAVRNVWHVLKPGGVVLFRDYGRGDLAQVRFKKGRWMEENFYVRGDGTRVYFFDEGELQQIWAGQEDETHNDKTLQIDLASLALEGSDDNKSTDDADKPEESSDSTARPKFHVMEFGVDRRMLVNRQRRLKMYRCWMQARFHKPE